MSNIHPTAIVHKNAKIADDAIIGPYAYIGENVTIGSRSEVMLHAVIDGNTTIGEGNKIYPSACIGLQPQDLKYKGEQTRLIIGDNNQIREFATMHLSATLEEDTVVGNNNLLMAYTHVAHNCQIGSNIVMANAVNLAGHVHVHDYAIVGGLTAVVQFVHIGAYAFIGGASSIKKDIPPFTRGQGADHYRVSGINSIGMTRKGFTPEQIFAVKKIYKLFYHSRLNVSQAIEAAEALPDITKEQLLFIKFCKESVRGITRQHE